MMEQSGSSVGTFRIRSTGYADDSEVALVATFKRASFLDFLYFTQLETSDPVTYNNQQTINGAYQQCTKTIAEGRYDQDIPGSSPTQACDRIYFIGGERIDGPLHTNDAFFVCNGQPIFGRTATDAIEVSSPPQGWSGCNGSSPNFLGTFVTNAPVLTPPPTNASLRTVPGSDHFTGQTRIVLNGDTYRKRRRISPVSLQRRHLRLERRLLGRVQPVHGDLSGVVDLWQRAGARQLLRTAHDRRRERHHRRQQPRALGQRDAGADREQLRPRLTSTRFSTQTSRSSCGNGSNGSGSITNLRIDAAILSIQHSFIVDHYSCGNPLGNLTVNGAIAQRFRGAVGTFSHPTGQSVSGYSKRYTYDDRLRYISPPHFLDPVESAWHVQRETVE